MVLGEYRYTDKRSSLFDLGNLDFPSTYLHLRLTYQSIVSSRIRRLESFPFPCVCFCFYLQTHTYLTEVPILLESEKIRERDGYFHVLFCSVLLCCV